MKYSASFLKELDNFKHKEIYAKIIALNFNESPIETIEGRATAGSINVDGNSAVRRTCSLTIVAENFNYKDYLWGVKTKFKLEIGVRNFINPHYEDIIWFPQGIYVLTSFNVSRSTTNFTINLSGKDKMCLLNGEIGGNLESSIDFGTIEEEDINGNWVIRKIPIQDIIRNAIHVYGKEPYHNIIINDLDSYGVELLEYRYDIPMYLYRSAAENAPPIYENAVLEDDSIKIYLDSKGQKETTLSKLSHEYLEPLITTLTNENVITKPVYTVLNIGGENKYTPWYIAKIEYGQTAGYRETELTYAGDLIAKIGESLTSVLDKIKNMLVEFEYFYNLEGQFVFQKKKSFTSTMWSIGNNNEDNIDYLLKDQIIDYVFTNNELITGFNNNPNLSNLKNDYSIWGTRRSVSGQEIPVHLRYAIDEKPFYYKNYDGKIYTSDVFDWREIIYQMALDYYKHNEEDDFEITIRENNLNYYPSGKTGYEQYYVDLQGFWRELYYPTIDEEYLKAKKEYESIKIETEKLKIELYGSDESGIGSIENDLIVLNNYLLNDEFIKAENLIKDWNDKKKYDFKDDSGKPIQNPILYCEMLQSLYSQKQNQLSLKELELENKYNKFQKLEEDMKDNFYTEENHIHKYWNKNVYEAPYLLNFWFDFFDGHGELSKYNTKNIGNRTKSIQDTNVKSIYFRETPEIIFQQVSTPTLSGFKSIQIPNIESMFTISAQGKSAKDRLDELLYQHSCCIETATITSIPIYYLQPNTRIKVVDEKSQLNGDYIINKITIPLQYNGTMSLNITKTMEDIV